MARTPVATGVPAPTRPAATARTTPGSAGTKRARASAPGRTSTRPLRSHAPARPERPTPRSNPGSTWIGSSGQRRSPAANAVAVTGNIQEPTTAPQTVTSSRISSSVAGPIPLTSIRSSTVANGPFWSRYSTIVAASTSPMPDSAFQLGRRGRVDVHRGHQPSCRSRPQARPRPAARPSARGSACRRPVAPPGSDRLRSAFGIWPPARSIASIDTVALGELVDAGLVDGAGDVDDERHRRTRRRRDLLGGAGSRLGDRHRLGQRARVPEPGAAQHSNQHDDQPGDLTPRQRVQTIPERHAATLRAAHTARSEVRHAGRKSSTRRPSMTLATNSRSP